MSNAALNAEIRVILVLLAFVGVGAILNWLQPNKDRDN